MVEKGGPSFDPEEEAKGVHEEVKAAFQEIERFDPGRAERDLKCLGDYARGKWKRSYALKSELLPAGEEVPAAPAPKTFDETFAFAQYRAALYAIQGTLSVAHSLLHNEIMRTPVGGVAWQTLGALSDRLSAISSSLRGEIARAPEGEGLVE